jgi:hypothetical protein
MKAWWAIAAAVVSLAAAGCSTAGHPTAATISTRAHPLASSDQAVALAQWRNRAEVAVASMQDSMRDLGIAMKSADYPAIQTNCHKVSDAATAIGSALPSPDSGLTAVMQGAVDSFRAATQSCEILAPGVSDEQVNGFLASMHRAIDQMDSAMLMMSTPARR